MPRSRVAIVTTVMFEPWVGPNYGHGSLWGVGVLILGYSHYHEFKEVQHAEYTRHVVGRHVRGINDKSRYWTKLARTFECADGRPAFWDSVAFYNYIQDFMSGPREDPTPRQVVAAWTPFNEVVARLAPDLILVTGKTLWSTIAARIRTPQTLKLSDSRNVPFRVMPNRGGAGVVGFINHPSSGGYSYDEWCPVVAALLAEAQQRVAA